MANTDNVELNFCYHCMSQMAPGLTVCPVCGHDNRQNENAEDILHEGTILGGKFLVGRMLGRGGFGVTYLGLDLALGIKVAIKEYYPVGVGIRSPHSKKVTISTMVNAEGFEKGCEEFQSEAKIIAQYDSPNIVHVRDYFRENGTAYIVMDFVEGNTLAQELQQQKDGRISWKRIVSLFEPLITELSKLHRKNMIHRDIKPDNIKITADENGNERLVLLDFGAARQFISEKVTKTYTAMVTPGYAPIEQYSQKSHQGPYTDVYGICATMYSMITGEKPPTAPDRIAETADLPTFSQAGLDVPPNVEKAIRHGMEVLSHNRTQTMGELHKELYGTELSEDSGKVTPINRTFTQNTISAAAEKPSRDVRQQRKKKNIWLIPVLLAVLIAGGFGAYKIIQNQQNKTKELLTQKETVSIAEIQADTAVPDTPDQDARQRVTETRWAQETLDALQEIEAEKTREAEEQLKNTQAAIDAAGTLAVYTQNTEQAAEMAESVKMTAEAEAARKETQSAVDMKDTEAAVRDQAETQAAQTAAAMAKTEEAEMRQTQTQAADEKSKLGPEDSTWATSGPEGLEKLQMTATQAAIELKNTEEAVRELIDIQAAETATSMELTREADMYQTQGAADAKNTEEAMRELIATQAAQTATSIQLTREADMYQTQTQAAADTRNTEEAIRELIAAQAAQTATSAELTREADLYLTQTQAELDAKSTQTQMELNMVYAAQTEAAWKGTQEAFQIVQTELAATQLAMDITQTMAAWSRTQEVVDMMKTGVAQTQEALDAIQMPTATPEPPAATATVPMPTAAPTMPPTVEPSPTRVPQNLLKPAAGSTVLAKKGESLLLSTENDVWASVYAVSVGQYSQCVKEGACEMPEALYSNAYPKMSEKDMEDLPMVFVTRDQASAYCEWAGMRLPTADEWRAAAKLPQGRKLQTGNVNSIELPRKGYLKSAKQNALTIPVTKLQSSPSVYNMVQMYGNTWEWIVSENDDPAFSYALGGAWNSYLNTIGSDAVYDTRSGYAADNIGFRCFADTNAITTDLFENSDVDVEDLFSRRQIDNSKMVPIPYSVFSMGSKKGTNAEKPVHDVTLSAYWIDAYEVTNAQYALCVADGVCTEPHERKSFRQSVYYGNPAFDDYPVIFVDYDQAKTYCEWAGGRLPTEAEWEYAAKGPNGNIYPWGNTFDASKLNYSGNGNYDTLAVNANPEDVSDFGVYDLGGNVSEWVSDVYQEDWYTVTNQFVDPTGPDAGKYMVIRGGSSQFSDNYARTTNRFYASSATFSVDRGFRCVVPGG